MSDETITIRGDQVEAVSPEGVRATMPLADFLARVAPPRMDTGGLVLPNDVRSIIARGPMAVWVHLTPPRVMNLRWLAGDSRMPFGPGATYRSVRLAMPYVLVLAVFGPRRPGELCLTHRNECFFLTGPLSSLDEPAFFPALLNCSKFATEAGHPLSWICTQRLEIDRLNAIADANERMRASLAALLDCLWHTGFNLSSEHHEETSWFSETVRRGVDPRLASVETWQAATEEDPMFVLDVPWVPTGRSVRDIIDRVFTAHHAGRTTKPTAAGLARIVHHHARRPK